MKRNFFFLVTCFTLIFFWPRSLKSQEILVRLLDRGQITEVALEEYVGGVLAGEIGYDWPLESLKSMAVCARTFALNKIITLPNEAYHLENDISDQVYRKNGFYRYDSIREAVMATKGEVLTYEGNLAEVYYCSNSGGFTASSLSVWGKEVPYLQALFDPYSLRAEKHVSWSVVLSSPEILRLLQLSGLLQEIMVENRDESGRAINLRVVVNGKSHLFSAKSLREMVGFDKLRSTLFDVCLENGAVLFSGRGWGHGVGLSQWGAKRMAEEGFSYQEILNFYFPGTALGIVE